jgi:hypothetical protein
VLVASEIRDGLLAHQCEQVGMNEIATINAESWTLVQTNGNPFNFANTFLAVQAKLGEFADQYAPLAAYIGVGTDYSAVVKEAQNQTSQMSSLKNRSNVSTAKISSDELRVSELAANTETKFADVERLRALIESDRKTTEEHVGATTAKLAMMDSEAQRAAGLISTIEAYQVKFDTFQKSLDDRENSFQVRNAEQVAIAERSGANEKEIESCFSLQTRC